MNDDAIEKIDRNMESMLDDEHYDLIVKSMILLKNKLTREGRYANAIDDALIKFLSAKRKYI